MTDIQRIQGYIQKHRPEQRAGQAAWNAVSAVRPDLAKRFEYLDPFYDDILTVAFLAEVCTVIEEEG